MAEKEVGKVNRFEALWRDEEAHPEHRTLGEKVALIARALHGLPQSDHEEWGKRAAECMLDGGGDEDPYEPAAKAAHPVDFPPYQTSHSNERHSLIHSAKAVLIARGSIDANLDALKTFRSRLAINDGTCYFRSGEFMQEIANSLLPRLSQAQRHADIEHVISTPGVELKRRILESMLHHNGSAFEQPALLASAKKAFAKEHLDGKGDRCLGAHYEHASFMTAREEWQDAMISPFNVENPTRFDLVNLSQMGARAHSISKMSEQWVAMRHAEWNKTHPAKNTLTLHSYPRADREIAHKFQQKINKVFWDAFTVFARINPAEAARTSIAYARDSLSQTWEKIGLSSVSATDYLYAPDIDPAKDRRQYRSPSAHWPLTGDPRESNLEGVTLNLLDCLILTRGTPEEVARLAREGHRPSDGLTAVMDSQALKKKFTLEQSLLISSFIANPLPSKSTPPPRL